MPIIKSAKKRVRTARKATIRNNKTKRNLRSALKLFSKKTTVASHKSAQSAVDTAIKKGILTKNKAGRIKKKLAAQAKLAGAKSTPTKKSVKPKTKPTVKPAAAKKKAHITKTKK
ncbi:MAG: 30S ribosomal protein S20 [Candidatus Saccharimonadales bacterium]